MIDTTHGKSKGGKVSHVRPITIDEYGILKKTVNLGHRYKERIKKEDSQNTVRKIKSENMLAEDGRGYYTNRNKNGGGNFVRNVDTTT
jgi:hypothetical protein